MSSYDISVSGLLAQGSRVNAIARNIANINTPNYAPSDVITISQDSQNNLSGVTTSDVSQPDESLENDLVDLSTAKNSYAADAKVIKAQDEMDQALLDIIT
jgi:flagellar basal body rod protein FlgC